MPEAAEYARAGTTTILRALASGELQGEQPRTKSGRGGKWRIHIDALDAWIRGEQAEVRVPNVARGGNRKA